MSYETCEHEPFIIYSNGAIECLVCHQLYIPERLREVYNGPAYKGRVTIIDRSTLIRHVDGQ